MTARSAMIALAAISFLATGALAPVRAADPDPARPEASGDIQVGTGLVCDTQQQVERFAALMQQDADNALKTVNDEAKNPTACGVATMAFLRGKTIGTAKVKDNSFDLVPILVVAVMTANGMRPIQPAAYFSILPVAGEEI